eukprot:m51a1_g1021 hypothetical protein (117) ;mRNA; f:644059-644409
MRALVVAVVLCAGLAASAQILCTCYCCRAMPPCNQPRNAVGRFLATREAWCNVTTCVAGWPALSHRCLGVVASSTRGYGGRSSGQGTRGTADAAADARAEKQLAFFDDEHGQQQLD